VFSWTVTDLRVFPEVVDGCRPGGRPLRHECYRHGHHNQYGTSGRNDSGSTPGGGASNPGVGRFIEPYSVLGHGDVLSR
jgi:hypothetical protein